MGLKFQYRATLRDVIGKRIHSLGAKKREKPMAIPYELDRWCVQ